MIPTVIHYVRDLNSQAPSTIVDQLIKYGCEININRVNWPEYPHTPDVTAYLGYCDKYLWIHYVVDNDFFKAIYHTDQDPVWQDSCVEFFLLQGDQYRNFEFNSLGICLSAIGAERKNRTSLDKVSLASIVRFPSLTFETLPVEGAIANWNLTVAIPLEMIGLKPGDEFMGNLYKCGDKTKMAHYLSWHTIDTIKPDFHQPRYFGLFKLLE